MKSLSTARFTSILCLLLFTLSYALRAQDSYSGETRKSINGLGLTGFQIDLPNGFTIHLEGTDTDSITYHYSFEGNRLAHELNFNQAEIQLDRRGTQAVLQIRFRDMALARRETNIKWLKELLWADEYGLTIKKQELVIQMPNNLAVQLKSQYSDVEVAGVGGDLRVSNRSGKVTASDIRGSLHIANEYGNITAERVDGQTRINSRSAEVTLRNIGGPIHVSSPYSDVVLSDVSGGVVIENQSGTIEAQRINGTVDVQADYSEIAVSDVKGRVQILSRSGDVTVTDIPSLSFAGAYTAIQGRQISGTEGSTIQNSSATINLADVSGSTRINGEYLELKGSGIHGSVAVGNRSGSIGLNDVDATVQIQGEYNEIDLSSYSGPVLEIQNRSGDVTVESTGSLTSVNISVVYGNVHFTMDEEYQGRYSLQTRYGNLNLGDSPFTLDANSPDSDEQEQMVSGSVGSSSSNNFSIQTQSGDLTVILR